jgi:hypothetical protein
MHPDAPGCVEQRVRLGERRVARQPQPARHVAEGVLVRHQLDAALLAEGIQPQDVLAGHRRRGGPHVGVAGVGEGVLGVQLKLVDLPASEQVHKLAQRLERRYLVAADVEHHAARREVRPVADRQRRQRRAVLFDDLDERADAVERASRVVRGDAHAVRADGERVALQLRHVVRRKGDQHIRRAGRAEGRRCQRAVAPDAA